jgi:hypothetical protein
MPYKMRLIKVLAACGLAGAILAPVAAASTNQVAMIQDNGHLYANPVQTLTQMKEAGATDVKVAVYWNDVAPDPKSTTAPKGFNGSNPADYPAANWAPLDNIVKYATADGLSVTFQPTGPVPKWAWGAGAPASTTFGWKPSVSDFKAFVTALGTRYSGKYTPAGETTLPKVSAWSVWNEPNYGPDLAPQGTDNNTVFYGAVQYRNLVNAAWQALKATGHSGNTFLLGETAPRGVAGKGDPGNFGGTMPLQFIATLYCATTTGKRLTGAAAKANDCPTSAATFKKDNPALFDASGYADHPYAQGDQPNIPTYACKVGGSNTFCWNNKTKQSSPYYADLAEIPRLEKSLDALQKAYGSGKKYSIWNTEYGYWTNPPDKNRGSVPIATAAYYDNWAEYLSYENSRIASFSQYQLYDPPGTDWTDGLLTAKGAPKATLAAYELPLYLPTTSASKPTSLTVWGAVRPAAAQLSAYAIRAQALVQFQPKGSSTWTTVKTVTITNARGYFDLKVPFSASGNVRIAWTSPFTGGPLGSGAVYSRTQAITVK